MSRSTGLIAAGTAAAAAAMIAVPWWVDSYWLSVCTTALIFALLAASLDLLIGYAGMPSLGHAAFFGAAGYGTGLAIVELELDPLAGAVAGIGLGTLVAVVFGPIVVRTRGVALLVITLAISQVLWGIAIRWEAVTGGFNGLAGISRPEVLGLDLSDSTTFYYVVACITVACVVALWRIASSPLGLTLRGVRDSETRMRQLGYRTGLYRWLAFSVAGFFAAIAGTMEAFHNQFIGPDAFFFTVSATVLLMVILGSAGTIWGPALAGVGLVLLEALVTDITERWLLILGLLYVAVALLAPQGLLRAAADALARRRDRRRGSDNGGGDRTGGDEFPVGAVGAAPEPEEVRS